MLTISIPPWRGGPMPGWSSSMPAGKKNIFGSQERSKAFFKYQILKYSGAATVRTFRPLSRSWRPRWQAGEKLSRSCLFLFFLMFKIEITTKYVIQLQNWETKGASIILMLPFIEICLSASFHIGCTVTGGSSQ